MLTAALQNIIYTLKDFLTLSFFFGFFGVATIQVFERGCFGSALRDAFRRMSAESPPAPEPPQHVVRTPVEMEEASGGHLFLSHESGLGYRCLEA